MNLTTNLPEFHNDLCDVARLFYGDAFSRGAEDGLTIEHQAQGWSDHVALYRNGERLASLCRDAQETCEEGLVRTRLRKRGAKTALYELLKGHTGLRLPWGSLTGIRPTRLFYEGLALGGEEAAERYLMDVFDVEPGKARLLRDIAAAQAATPPRAENEFDVYVGIPFCPTRCSYCSFAAVGLQGAREREMVEPYLAALCAEISAGAEDMRRMGLRARAVYVGGGTPTTLSPEQMDRLLALLREGFAEAYEWTVEAGRPDAMDEARLEGLRKRGIGRISVNPQTMNEDTLCSIGRAHKAQDIREAMGMARRYGFPIINMDIIAALPGEGEQDIRRTVESLLEMRPENVTVHTLALKRASRLLTEGAAGLPPADVAARMVDIAAQMLKGAGYQPYYLYRQKYMAGNLENVGYALPGTACLYNIDNMEETAPVLAFGAGAITKWVYSRQRRIERAPNLRNVEEYIARVGEMIQKKRGLF